MCFDSTRDSTALRHQAIQEILNELSREGKEKHEFSANITSTTNKFLELHMIFPNPSKDANYDV